MVGWTHRVWLCGRGPERREARGWLAGGSVDSLLVESVGCEGRYVGTAGGLVVMGASVDDVAKSGRAVAVLVVVVARVLFGRPLALQIARPPPRAPERLAWPSRKAT